MATTTTNMGMTKPGTTDLADIAVINTNMDKLDTHRHLGGTDGLAARAVQGGTAANRPAAGTLGQLYVALDSPGAMYFDNGSAWTQVQPVSGAGMTKIAEVSLSSSAATIDFTSIPSAYRHLEVVLQGRGDYATMYSGLFIQFNSDTGSNYDTQFQLVYGTTLVGSEAVGAGSCLVGLLPGASAPSAQGSATWALVGGYAGTAFRKTLVYLSSAWLADSSAQHYAVSGAANWRSTSGITSLRLYPGNGNFITGTVASLYGLS